MRTSCFALVSVIMASSFATAQDFFRDRSWRIVELAIDDDPTYPEIRVNLGDLVLESNPGQGNAAATIRNSDTGVTIATLSLPFHRFGACQEISPGSFLVSGLHYASWTTMSPEAILCRLSIARNPAGTVVMQVAETATIGQFDPAWMHFNPNDGLIFFGDYGTGLLYTAAWAPGGPLPQSTTLRPPGATLAALMPLCPGWAMGTRTDYGQLKAEPSGTILFSWMDGKDWRIALDPVSGYADATERVPSSPTVTIEDLYCLGGTRPIVVTSRGASAALALKLVDVDAGVTLGTFTCTPGSPTSIGPFSYINDHPTRDYQIRGQNDNKVWAEIQAGVRIGNPVPAASGLSIGRGILLNWGHMAPGVHNIGAMASTAGSGVALCALNMAWRRFDPNGGYTDPVSNGVLQPDASVTFTVREGVARSSLSNRVDIPEWDELHGSVLLFQYVAITSTNQVSGSDVFGAMIDTLTYKEISGNVASMSAGLSSSQPSSAPPVSSEAAEKARRRLLKRVAGPAHEESARRLLER